MATLDVYQRLFVNYLVNDAKDDPVKAAKLAGYANPEKAAVRLMKSRTIAAEMERRLEQAGAMSVEEILARLSTIASLDVMEFVEFTLEAKKDGTQVEKAKLDLKKIKKLRKGNLIKDLKIRPSGEIEVNFHNAVEAMDKLAKYHGMFKERIEIEHFNGDAGNDRLVTIVANFMQLSGQTGNREADRPSEPGGLCDRGERGEMDASPALEPDQPTLALGGSEEDRQTADHARAETRKIRDDLEILPGVDVGKEAEPSRDPGQL